jgi:pyruvate/2-oxoglutarate dehydrogenase complex dihydrolipoamide acyltransferase (E2) component
MTDVTMPQLGETVAEGTVTRWLRNIGDTVVAEEPLLEVSTDKVDTEVPAPASGVLAEIVVAEDMTVPVGTVIARIGAAASAASAKSPIDAPITAAPAPVAPIPVSAPAVGASATRLKGLYVAGYLTTVLNDFTAADLLLEAARALAQRLGDPSGAAYVSQIRGLATLFHGDPAGAATLFENALAGHRALSDQAASAYDQIELALAAALLGDDQRARGLLEECLQATQSRGEHWITALALWALGIEACRRGDHATAAERESIQLRLPFNDRLDIGLNLDVLAWTAAAEADSERAARLFGAAQAVPRALGTPLAPLGHLSELHAHYEAAARRTLGDAAFERAFQLGLGLGFDQAVAYALGATGRSAAPSSVAQREATQGPLTRREREIAELITRGLSNKEIAGTLVISQRTAEGHVEHILTKLGFTSRAQIAAWVAERRASSRG